MSQIVTVSRCDSCGRVLREKPQVRPGESYICGYCEAQGVGWV